MSVLDMKDLIALLEGNFEDGNKKENGIGSERLDKLSELEQKIGYHFQNKMLLNEAMTHGSARMSDISKPHYQRLEFLGDSLLYPIISDYYYEKYPNATPGQLTDLRAYHITEERMSNIAMQLKICTYVVFGDSVDVTKFGRWGEFIEALIAAVFKDSGGMDGNGFRNTKQLILKLWKLQK